MTDFENVLPLWHELERAGADYVLATIVAVEGPSYRKPGARMLVAKDGRRAGTVSGGCLEAEVAKRAWWLTESGPTIERYSTVPEYGEMPYGSGCGGVVFILLERRATAARLLAALESAFHARTPMAIATVLQGPGIGTRAFAGVQTSGYTFNVADNLVKECALHGLADLALSRRQSLERTISFNSTETSVWVDYRPARPGLWIFGAGDDAKPLLHLARTLGWFVAVADGRSNLVTRDRFPDAGETLALPIQDLPNAAPAHLDLRPTDAAVVMTHSFEQDSRILASLLAGSDTLPLAYLGVLGPQRRTRDVLAEAARLALLSGPEDWADRWLAQLHAPTGLDLGAETPASIALSILAEIQQVLAAASAEPLRRVRAVTLDVAQS